ncbi:hypothetical protein ACFYTQ_13070 [Nocardia sp. NPDC004068]|uniref:hypothetical protein n=1 Tax=Nocardia sp. NPDC004068 TaxID=3364303 RepID=UPI00368AD27C
MDSLRRTRLLEFDGGVLEIYDYGDEDHVTGVWLELYGRRGMSTFPALEPVEEDYDNEVTGEAS